MFEVMNRKMDAYCITLHGRNEAVKWYDEHKRYIQSETSTMYDYVLVETKRVWSGQMFKIRIFWRPSCWYWKPSIAFRFGFRFAWLGLLINTGREYDDVPWKVIGDHNKEKLDAQNPN